MLLDLYRVLRGCNVDSEQPTSADANPVVAFAFRVLNLRSDTSASEELKAPKKVSKDETRHLWPARRPA